MPIDANHRGVRVTGTWRPSLAELTLHGITLPPLRLRHRVRPLVYHYRLLRLRLSARTQVRKAPRLPAVVVPPRLPHVACAACLHCTDTWQCDAGRTRDPQLNDHPVRLCADFVTGAAGPDDPNPVRGPQWSADIPIARVGTCAVQQLPVSAMQWTADHRGPAHA